MACEWKWSACHVMCFSLSVLAEVQKLREGGQPASHLRHCGQHVSLHDAPQAQPGSHSHSFVHLQQSKWKGEGLCGRFMRSPLKTRDLHSSTFACAATTKCQWNIRKQELKQKRLALSMSVVFLALTQVIFLKVGKQDRLFLDGVGVK